MTYQPIKHWATDDRPREKLIKFGPAILSDAELLAILIRTGGKGRSALDLARELMELSALDLHRLGKMRLAEFSKVPDIGEAKAVTLLAALELGRRRESIAPPPLAPIDGSRAVVAYLRPLLKDQIQEVFVVLYLNQANVVVHVEWLSKGGISSTVVDIRLVMRVGLEQTASSLILCHNHPSGSLKPSQADTRSTHKLFRAAGLLEMQLIDHVIVSDQGWYSFADDGKLNPGVPREG